MRRGPGVDRVEDLRALSFADGEVGTALCLDTLEHCEDPVAACRELARVTAADGGVCVISSVMLFGIHGYPSDYFRFTPEGFRSMLSASTRRGMAGVGGPDIPTQWSAWGLAAGRSTSTWRGCRRSRGAGGVRRARDGPRRAVPDAPREAAATLAREGAPSRGSGSAVELDVQGVEGHRQHLVVPDEQAQLDRAALVQLAPDRRPRLVAQACARRAKLVRRPQERALARRQPGASGPRGAGDLLGAQADAAAIRSWWSRS